MQQPSLSGELIKHFLDDARHSIDAGNAEQALQVSPSINNRLSYQPSLLCMH